MELRNRYNGNIRLNGIYDVTNNDNDQHAIEDHDVLRDAQEWRKATGFKTQDTPQDMERSKGAFTT